jgi:hypothetical protein
MRQRRISRSLLPSAVRRAHIPPGWLGRNYLQPVGNEQITSDQAAALPQPLAAALGRLVGEYEGRASREAECARDADKLDMLLQALEYREVGWRNLDPFIQTAISALRTPSGRRLGRPRWLSRRRPGGRASPAACPRSAREASTAGERPRDSKGPKEPSRASTGLFPAARRTPSASACWL